MVEPLVPFGYDGAMLTWKQMEGMTTWNRLHPEVRRRFKAMSIEAARKRVRLGVGEAWRIQPDPPPPGFADPGNSWHESCPVNPPSPTALAIDTVPESGWDWMDAHCAAYGLRTFADVNDEPWHCQPSDIPGDRDYATTLPPISRWVLPKEEDVPLTDREIDRIVEAVVPAVTEAVVPAAAAAVWNHIIAGDETSERRTARWRLRQINGTVRNYLGGWTETTEVPADGPLLKQIHVNVNEILRRIK